MIISWVCGVSTKTTTRAVSFTKRQWSLVFFATNDQLKLGRRCSMMNDEVRDFTLVRPPYDHLKLRVEASRT